MQEASHRALSMIVGVDLHDAATDEAVSVCVGLFISRSSVSVCFRAAAVVYIYRRILGGRLAFAFYGETETKALSTH